MSQDYVELDTLDSTTSTIDRINANVETLRSTFEGYSPPASPVEGQLYYQTGTNWLYVWDTSAWRPIAAYSIISDITNHATVGTSEETLTSYNLIANYISANGNGVEIEAWFRTATNANRKRAKLKLDGTIVADSGEVTLNNKLIRLNARIIRTGSATQIAAGRASNVDPPEEIYSTPTADLTINEPVIATGETLDSAGDLTLIFFAMRPIFGHTG